MDTKWGPRVTRIYTVSYGDKFELPRIIDSSYTKYFDADRRKYKLLQEHIYVYIDASTLVDGDTYVKLVEEAGEQPVCNTSSRGTCHTL